MFCSSGSAALFPRGSHLCRASVQAVEKLINLRQNTQKEEKVLRELVERAGEAKGYRKRSKAPELVLVLAGNSPVP